MPILRGSGYRPGDIRIFAGVPERLPAGFDLADWRIAAKADYPRLAAAIGQAWRDGADVYDTATHFRFPDGTRFIRGGSWVSTPAPAGGYPLDDAGSTLGAFGFGAIDTTGDPARQVGELTITDAGINKYFAFRAPADVAADMPGAGVVGYELDLQAVPHDPGMTGALRPALVTAYLTAANAPAQLVIVHAEVTSAATFDVRAVSLLPGGFGTVTVAAGLPIADLLTTKIGTYVDTATGDMGVLVNATDSGYLGLVPPGTWAKLSPGIGIDHDATGVDGTTFRAGFVSAADAVTLTNWPVGTTFLSAGGGGAPTITSDVGTRAGSATTGGTALTAAQLAAHVHQVNNGIGGSGGTEVSFQAAGYNTAAMVDTTSTGDGDPHDHSVNPEHSLFLVLVKL